jgi:hypothetical protein
MNNQASEYMAFVLNERIRPLTQTNRSVNNYDSTEKDDIKIFNSL